MKFFLKLSRFTISLSSRNLHSWSTWSSFMSKFSRLITLGWKMRQHLRADWKHSATGALGANSTSSSMFSSRSRLSCLDLVEYYFGWRGIDPMDRLRSLIMLISLNGMFNSTSELSFSLFKAGGWCSTTDFPSLLRDSCFFSALSSSSSIYES